ncbi:acyl-CoA dehydrogenase family protein [Agarilytica rhodophyticola]|uniref:acyl-CoA dehydrogenase family protein n=1 Tax=Agarilytica rhodophyticola TaxID=1737490 RepID=UPI000B3438B9|nr:acyl-CoA dehydrogenase family protein [Agarilytica rhodophyticola]
MNVTLTEEQLAFQEAARDFAAGELSPNSSQWDQDEFFPIETIKRSGQLGFCGMYSPEQWGGLGLSRFDTSLILEELAYGCTATAAFISIHNMATWMLCNWGSESLKDEWANKLTIGEKLASYCLTEPNSGSDAAAMRTNAKREGDHYIINGSKAFISGAGSTELLIVMARTSPSSSASENTKTISAFAVPADLPGISYGANEKKMGWKNQPTKAITFDDVKVPVSHLLGNEGEGFKIAMAGLDGGRVNIATCSLGAAQKAIDLTTSYMAERKQFNRALTEFQALQFRLADMTTELIAARNMVHLAAAKIDQDHQDKTSYCAMAKRFATDIGFKICDQAVQLHGGYGYLKDYQVEQLFRDVRVHQILEGTNEIMRLIISRRVLAEDKEPLK